VRTPLHQLAVTSLVLGDDRELFRCLGERQRSLEELQRHLAMAGFSESVLVHVVERSRIRLSANQLALVVVTNDQDESFRSFFKDDRAPKQRDRKFAFRSLNHFFHHGLHPWASMTTERSHPLLHSVRTAYAVVPT